MAVTTVANNYVLGCMRKQLHFLGNIDQNSDSVGVVVAPLWQLKGGDSKILKFC